MFVQDLQIDKNIAGIYKFIFPNGKIYIGKSINIYIKGLLYIKVIFLKKTLFYIELLESMGGIM